MYPVLSRKVIEGKENIFILRQALTGTGELLPVEGDKGVHGDDGLLPGICPVDVVDPLLRLRLCPLRHLVEDVRRLVDPAALLSCVGVYFSKSRPEAKAPVADGETGPGGETSFLEVREELHPGELALPVSVEDSHEFLGAVLAGADNDEHALPFVFRVLKTDIEVDAVHPEVGVSFPLKRTLRPLPVFLLPLPLETDNGVRGEPFRVLAENGGQGIGEVAGGDALEVKDGYEIIEGGDAAQIAGKDGTGEGFFFLPSVPYPGLSYRYGADAGEDGTLRGETVTDDCLPVAGSLCGVQGFHVICYLFLDGALEKLSRPFADDLLEKARCLLNLFLIFVLFRVILLHKTYPFFAPLQRGSLRFEYH